MDFSKKRKAEENGEIAATTTTLSPGDVRKLLQPFTPDQLLDVLQSAVVQHLDVLDDVRSIADRDSTLRKLFIRGLGAETTSESLSNVFASYGELDEGIVIFDKNTGKSKGYGFVTFKHADCALLAHKEPSKKIDGRITVTQFAASGLASANNPSAGNDVSARKIFVGNVPFDVSSERLLSHFSTYGDIEEGPLGFDKATGKSKGFAFFVYKTEDGARAALVDPMKNIDGHQVACKLAVDNKKGRVGAQGSTGLNGDGMFQGSQYGAQPPPGGLYSGYPGGGHHGQGPPPLPAGNYGVNSSFPHSAGSLGMPSGAYPGGGNYGLTSSVRPSQHSQPPPMPRVPPGGMYQGMPPYY